MGVPYGGKGGKSKGKGKGGKGYYGYYGHGPSPKPYYRNLEGEEAVEQEDRELAGYVPSYPVHPGPSYYGYGYYGGKGSKGCGKGKGNKGGGCGYWETVCQPAPAPCVGGGKGNKGGCGYYGGKGG